MSHQTLHMAYGTIGVISDTHGLVRPEALVALQGVTWMIHAGDIGTPEVLQALQEIAPVVAVRGNNDKGPWAEALPETLVLIVGAWLLYVLHDVKALGRNPQLAGFRAVIAGHSHRPRLEERHGVQCLKLRRRVMKRVLLFVATNLAILVVLGIVVSLLGLDSTSTTGLLIIAAIFGMGGSFLSLAMSKWIAKRATGAEVIDHPRGNVEVWLLQTVERQARKAGIGMPEVAVYPSPEINAFATGMNRDKALVAVSTGLLENMERDEAEAVLGHEVSHVANGDMVTLALIQGVLNTFVILIARLVANLIGAFLSRDDEEGEGGLSWLSYMAVTIVLELVLGILASIIVMWFSRQREFRADAGSADLAGRRKMIAALRRLQQLHEPSHLPDQMAAFGINGKQSGLAKLFMSHPPLEERIAALEAGR